MAVAAEASGSVIAMVVADPAGKAELFPTLGFFGLERETALRLALEKPVTAIRLCRPDGKGLHGARLSVSVRWEDGGWALLHQDGSDESYELAFAAAIACVPNDEVGDTSALSPSEWRNVLTTRIADTVADPSAPLDAVSSYPEASSNSVGVNCRSLPAEPERFLCERYGADWMISDQFHEWPWQLLAEPVT